MQKQNSQSQLPNDPLLTMKWSRKPTQQFTQNFYDRKRQKFFYLQSLEHSWPQIPKSITVLWLKSAFWTFIVRGLLYFPVKFFFLLLLLRQLSRGSCMCCMVRERKLVHKTYIWCNRKASTDHTTSPSHFIPSFQYNTGSYRQIHIWSTGPDPNVSAFKSEDQ